MGLRLAGHPLHPALVHFPVALWFTAVFWDALGWWRPDPLWWQFAYWSLALGLAAAVPVAATGFADYLGLSGKHPGFDTATLHMLAMLGATSAFGASWLLRVSDAGAAAPSLAALALGGLGAVLLAAGGWLGGTLVYRFGVGRGDRELNEQTQSG